VEGKRQPIHRLLEKPPSDEPKLSVSLHSICLNYTASAYTAFAYEEPPGAKVSVSAFTASAGRKAPSKWKNFSVSLHSICLKSPQ
jgi:hypothetical protein